MLAEALKIRTFRRNRCVGTIPKSWRTMNIFARIFALLRSQKYELTLNIFCLAKNVNPKYQMIALICWKLGRMLKYFENRKGFTNVIIPRSGPTFFSTFRSIHRELKMSNLSWFGWKFVRKPQKELKAGIIIFRTNVLYFQYQTF